MISLENPNKTRPISNSIAKDICSRKLHISNPKKSKTDRDGSASWFSHYAGYSESFATNLLKSLPPNREYRVLDPWNGSGTTTSTCVKLGHVGFGYDLNPIMVLIAKSRLLSKSDALSVEHLSEIMIERSNIPMRSKPLNEDQLLTWFYPSSVSTFRRMESIVLSEFGLSSSIDITHPHFISKKEQNLASFLFVCLFKCIRMFIAPFKSSNPTWIKKPASPAHRVRPSTINIINLFRDTISRMTLDLNRHNFRDTNDGKINIEVGSSLCLPIRNKSVDIVLASPPYCTRIDYAMLTLPELLFLGNSNKHTFKSLRENLMGKSVVLKEIPHKSEKWGKDCILLLDKIFTHDSKASKTYYYKNHLQYFYELFESLKQIYQALTKKGICILVLQDSYYKDIHNDLPKIVVSMGNNIGFSMDRRVDFEVKRSLSAINTTAWKDKQRPSTKESVIILRKR